MASHGCLLSRPATTCLAGLRTLAMSSSSFGSTITTAGPTHATASARGQTRAKSTHLRPVDQGVVVRLLADIPKFGRKGTILRTERGRMRNDWFPFKKAEYLTRARLQELVIGPNDIGERDRAYVPLSQDLQQEPALTTSAPKPKPKPMSKPESTTERLLHHISEADPAPAPEPAPEEPKAPADVNPESIAHAQMHSLLSQKVPQQIRIPRRLVDPSVLTPKRRLSPLVAQASSAIAPTANLPIDGAVSVDTVLSHVRGYLGEDLVGQPMSLEPKQIRFVDLPGGSDTIKTTGTFRVEIQIGQLKPVVRQIRVVPDRASADN